jgi:hypothetical protein
LKDADVIKQLCRLNSWEVKKSKNMAEPKVQENHLATLNHKEKVAIFKLIKEQLKMSQDTAKMYDCM